MTVENSRVVTCRVNPNKYYITLVDLDNHNASWGPDIRSTLCAGKHSSNYIRVHNKLRIYISVTVKIPGKHVHTVLWRGEYSRMLIIMVADICNNGVKVNGRTLGYFRCIDIHVCRKCNAIWEWRSG